MAPGPVQHPEYLEYSRNFEKRYCVDLSKQAFAEAKRRLGDQDIYLHGSVFDLELDDDFFDCSISLHTIYHSATDAQEEAVRKLVKVARQGMPIIIVYSNRRAFFSRARILLGKIKQQIQRVGGKSSEHIQQGLYFFAHPLSWGRRFDDVADIHMFPWRSFDSKLQKIVIPNNKIG